MKYPRFIKRIESNKTTDQNFYKILSKRTYIHVSLPYEGNFSVERYSCGLPNYTTDKDFEDGRSYIVCSEEDFKDALNSALSSFGVQSQDQTIKSLKEELEKTKKLLQKAKNIFAQIEE